MPYLVNVFDYESDFTSEIKEYYETAIEWLGEDRLIFLDFTADDFEEAPSYVSDAYFEVVAFIKARLLPNASQNIVYIV